MGERGHFPIGSLVLGLGFGAVLLLTWLLVRPPPPPASLQGVLRGEFRPIEPFLLSSRGHGPISAASLRGKWSFVYFGYLSCPDDCPDTLHQLARLWRQLRDQRGAEPDDAQVIFVSVDPGRDTTERLAAHVAHFDRTFIGATAGKGQIDRLARQFGATYRVEPETAPGQYTVAHSGAVYLVDPHGRLVATFSEPHYAATINLQFAAIRDYFSAAAQSGERRENSLLAHRSGRGAPPVPAVEPRGDRAGSLVAPVASFSLANRPDDECADQCQVEGQADSPEGQGRTAVAGRRDRGGGFDLLAMRVVHGMEG